MTLLLLLLLAASSTLPHAVAPHTAASIVDAYVASKPLLTSYERALTAALRSMDADVDAQTRPIFRVAHNHTFAMHPLTFSIPAHHIQDIVPVKANLLATVVPGDMATYAFLPRPHHTPPQLASLERDYYLDMQRSLFGLTWKKSGWDCLRHVELLASGCVPLFTDVATAPRGVLALYPKRVLRMALSFPGVEVVEGVPGHQPERKRRIVINASAVEPALYAATATALLDFTRRRLASDAVAAYVLNRMGVAVVQSCDGDRLCWVRRTTRKVMLLTERHRTRSTTRPTRVLYLTLPKDTVDYMADTLLHGFKALLGDANVVDYHRRAILYQTPNTLAEHVWAPLRSSQYGWGFTYAHSMLFGLGVGDDDEQAVRASIAAREFDVVVLSLVHRGPPPLLRDVCAHYPRRQVAVVHGHDRPPTDDELAAYDACAGWQFVREAY